MKKEKVINITKTILNVLVTVFVLAFLLMVCLQRFSNNQLSLFNFRMFTVVSGSMEPKYQIGDVLIAQEKKPSDIKVGDAISYLGTAGGFADKVITHEVIRIEKDKDGKYIFHTKGLANLVEDPPVYESQLYGKVVYRPVILSFIYKVVGTKVGLFIFVVLPLFYIAGSEMLTFLLDKEERRREELKLAQESEKDKEKKQEKSKKDVKEVETKSTKAKSTKKK